MCDWPMIGPAPEAIFFKTSCASTEICVSLLLTIIVLHIYYVVSMFGANSGQKRPGLPHLSFILFVFAEHAVFHNKVHNLVFWIFWMSSTNQRRIQDFGQSWHNGGLTPGGPDPKIYSKLLENCMILKRSSGQGWGRAPRAPWIR